MTHWRPTEPKRLTAEKVTSQDGETRRQVKNAEMERKGKKREELESGRRNKRLVATGREMV